MTLFTLKITKVTVLSVVGAAEQVLFEVEGPTPFPELDAQDPGKYTPVVKMECRRGYALQWLEQMGVDLSTVTVISNDPEVSRH